MIMTARSINSTMSPGQPVTLNAVSAAWPNSTSVPRYRHVKVVLMSWDKDDDPQIQEDVRALDAVFRGLYHYDTEMWKIPSRRSAVELSRKVADTLDAHGREGNLIIFYYAGHARVNNTDQGSIIVWAATRARDSPVVHSSILHPLLAEIDCHVLLLHDCLDAPAPAKTSSTFTGNGLIETLAAGSIDTPSSEDADSNGNWFTTSVIQELARAAHTGAWLSGVELHKRLITRLHGNSNASTGILFRDSLYSFVQIDRRTGQPIIDPPTRRIPIHRYQAKRPQTVLLAPLEVPNNPSDEESYVLLHPPKSPVALEQESTGPGVLVTCRLRDPRVDVERWRQWLENAPEPARSIQMSAIYPSFAAVLIVELPLAVWDMLTPSPAISFIAYTTGKNHISEFRRALTYDSEQGTLREDYGARYGPLEQSERGSVIGLNGGRRESQQSRSSGAGNQVRSSENNSSSSDLLWPQVFEQQRTAVYQLEDIPYCLNVAELLPNDGSTKTDKILRAFVQDDGPAVRYIADELRSFCASVDFEALASGRDVPPEPVAILDERVLNSRGPLGNEVKTLNRAQLYQALIARSLPQLIDTETADNTAPRKRLLYVTNLDAYSALAIAATASERQAWALRDFVYNHLTLKAGVDVKIDPSATNPEGFHISFHLPFLAWRQSQTPSLDTRLKSRAGHNQNSESLRHVHNVSTLGTSPVAEEDGDENPTEPEHLAQEDEIRLGTYLHEAHISCMVAGLDNRHWTAYGFFDTYHDQERTADGQRRWSRRDVFAYQATQGGMMRDPLTCGKLMLAAPGDNAPSSASSSSSKSTNTNIWDAREYFLHAMHGCVREVAGEWKNTARQILLAVEREERLIQGGDANHADQAAQVLEQLIHGLSGTLSAWEKFHAADLPAYFDLGSATTKALVREIDNDIRDLEALQEELRQKAEALENLIVRVQNTPPTPPTTSPSPPSPPLSFPYNLLSPLFNPSTPTTSTTTAAATLCLLLPIPLALAVAGLLILLLPSDWIHGAGVVPSLAGAAVPNSTLSTTAAAAAGVFPSRVLVTQAAGTGVMPTAAAAVVGAGNISAGARYLITSAVVATMGGTLGAVVAGCVFLVLLGRSAGNVAAAADVAAGHGHGAVKGQQRGEQQGGKSVPSTPIDAREDGETWPAWVELLFADMADLERARITKPASVAKLEGLCTLARAQNLNYAWNDTCCIDKSSSAELSEVINSMYRWYAESRVCYAYLWDVQDSDERSQVLEQVAGSRWFTRGWTLQELIAPKRVEFYTKMWTYLGEKGDDDLLPILSKASLVDECVLARVVPLKGISVAKKMYWASKRETTRKEDIAYCLLGLFDVNMPLLYGEGKKAFIRLQQEIMKTTNDHSILAWFCVDPDELPADGGKNKPALFQLTNGALASSPRCFALSGDIWPLDPTTSGIPVDRSVIRSTGTTVEFWAVRETVMVEGNLGKTVFLHCQWGSVPGVRPILVTKRVEVGHDAAYARVMVSGQVTTMHKTESEWKGFWAFFNDLPVDAPEELQPADDIGGGRNSRLERVLLNGTSCANPDDPRTYGVYPLRAIPSAPIRTLWILPEPVGMSKAPFTVLDVCPRRRWNHGSHQFFWHEEEIEIEGPQHPASSVGMLLGVARIRFGPLTPVGQERPCGTALVAFGYHRGSKFRLPWCFLEVETDGQADLAQAYARIVSQHENGYFGHEDEYLCFEFKPSSVPVGEGLVLQALATRTRITGSDYLVLQIGVVSEKKARSSHFRDQPRRFRGWLGRWSSVLRFGRSEKQSTRSA
ncbi:hypothetical protein VTJ04DRAFT_70 [Mycothermus thermophilus]|uniref:uncharacterized protein n=1 Tax=Humicola insolens TaxID=85995 RepID=UPI003743D9D7